jgi:two-component system sensor histidine kinase KdpD
MDLQAIINLRPEVVIVDELAHTNIEENEKRWQDVLRF